MRRFRPPRRAGYRAALLVAMGGLLACGSSQRQGQAPAPVELTQAHRQVFENGIDYLDDPSALGGRWELEWEQKLADRVKLAHYIGIVRVDTMRMDQEPDRPPTYRLHAEVEQRLLGHAPGGELSLASRPDEAGFPTLDGKQERILEQRFVAFVVWSRGPAGRRVPHWHLAAASDVVVARVHAVIDEERPEDLAPGEGPRVIRHRNP